MSDRSTEKDVLTDEVRDALRDWWDEETTVGVESAFPLIHRVIRERMAHAWEQGWNARARAQFFDTNPHRNGVSA